MVSITKYGAFVGLAAGIEGLIHESEFDDKGRNKVDLEVDDVTSVKIIELSPLERKIGLGIPPRSHNAGWRLWLQGRGERIREVVLQVGCAGAHVWSMVRESGGRGGSRGPRPEQDSRGGRIGHRPKKAELVRDLARTAVVEGP